MSAAFLIPSTWIQSDRRSRNGRVHRTSNILSSRCLMAARDKQIWINPLSKDVLTAAIEAGVTTVVGDSSEQLAEWQNLAAFTPATVEGDRLKTPGVEGHLVTVASAEDQERAMDLAGKAELIALRADDWRIIPVENLIAKYHETSTLLYVYVSTASDAEIMLTTLEIGVDGVILRTDDPIQAKALSPLVQRSTQRETLEQFIVQSVRPIGLGDRACIDTCVLLGVDEGLLVGSSSQGMLLVLSEAAESDYVPSRPFRVNAGTVASYCLTSGGKTRYLAEFGAGDNALAVAKDGSARPVPIARSKVEKRPMLLIEFYAADDRQRRYSVILQNAETVRLADGEGGTGKPVTGLRTGDSVLGRRDSFARHVGMRINESILET